MCDHMCREDGVADANRAIEQSFCNDVFFCSVESRIGILVDFIVFLMFLNGW